MQVREAAADDAAAVTELRRIVYPYKVMSVEAGRHMITEQPPATKPLALVVEVDGRVVAWGWTGLNVWTSEPGRGELSVYVHPEYRGQGIGSDLYARLVEHLESAGGTRAQTFAQPAGVGFAKSRGFEQTRLMHYSGVDPRVLPEQPPVPDGFELVTFDQLEPRQVYEADSAASLDEPGDAPLDAIDYDEWLREIWNAPGSTHELSVAALAGDVVACFTVVERAGDRIWSGMTGTLPEYRGRGLAKVVKSVALRRSAADGVTSAYTSNDDRNGPMLAINTWLGYRIVATETGLSALLDS